MNDNFAKELEAVSDLNMYVKYTTQVKPDYNISFQQEGKNIGKLDFNGDEMKFIGEADESAKVFFDWLANSFSGRLKEEREKEREACAKLCEEREEYSMQIPCPDGIVGCCVFHSVRGSKLKDGRECAEAIRRRAE